MDEWQLKYDDIMNKRLKRMIKILSIMPDSFRDGLRYKRTLTSIVAESAIKNPDSTISLYLPIKAP
jgi:hypothetical protein